MFAFSRAKYASFNLAGMGTLDRSTVVDVAMTYAAFTRLIGTPLTANGPVTSNKPDSSALRRTTRFPRLLRVLLVRGALRRLDVVGGVGPRGPGLALCSAALLRWCHGFYVACLRV